MQLANRVRVKPIISLNRILNSLNSAVDHIELDQYTQKRMFNGGAAALANICQAYIELYDRPIIVLIPGYFCGQSLRYLRNTRSKIIFYPLNDDLSPNFHLIDLILNESEIDSIDVFIHVHFFGVKRKQEESRSFADNMGCILIEDCAHLSNPLRTGSFVGDFLVFTPHKHYPLPPIALVFEKRGISSSLIDGERLGFPYKWILKQLYGAILNKKYEPVWQTVWNATEVAIDNKLPHRFTEKLTTSTLVEAIKKPSCLYQRLSPKLMTRIRKVDGWKLFISLSEYKDHPYLIGVLCDSNAIAKKRFEYLNKEGQLVLQWPDLPVEIQRDPFLEKRCVERVERIIFFYVHDQIDLETWLSKFDRALSHESF